MKEKPDILVFLSDDHAAWANGCYGNREVSTPNIDFLAETGVLMENAFTPTPVCSPARACVFTGRIPSQHGLHDFLGTPEGADVDRSWLAGERLLPEILRDGGYQTALVGKWHLGEERTAKQGFDYNYTIGPEYPIRHGGRRTWYRGAEAIERTGYLSQIIADESIAWLRARDRTRPFFLVVGLYASHSPWEGHPERLASRFRKRGVKEGLGDAAYPFGAQRRESLDATRDDPEEARCQYCAGVSEIDETVGRLLDAIEGEGDPGRTLVAYTSDHGLNCGQHGLWGKGNATYPLNMLEESIRVPLIFNAPGLIFSRQRRREFVDHTDFLPTILDFAGLAEDEAARVRRNSPGRSLHALLTNGDVRERPRDTVFCEYGPVRMASDGRHKLCLFPEGGRSLLFDLAEDPRETRDRFADPALRDARDRLEAGIAAHFGRYREEGNDGARWAALPDFNSCVAWKG